MKIEARRSYDDGSRRFRVNPACLVGVSYAGGKAESGGVLESSVASVTTGSRPGKHNGRDGNGDAPRGQRNSNRRNRVAGCRIGNPAWIPEKSSEGEGRMGDAKIGDWRKKGRV
jgi:hypothetical protein